jgi:ABC-2 type transport system ATP-binding protein
MIQVDSLTKDYAGRRGIQNVTFSVDKGEILGFLGPNGAGKTTTMRILTGYLPPTSGHASIAGFDIETQSLDVRRHIGYLPESVPLYKDLSVRDYLDFVTRLRDIPKDQRRAKIDVAMEKANVTDVADVFIGKLSKGYRQRVGLAQAVVHEPDVMILDEPTEGLDPRQRTETRLLIRDLAREHTVILSTHILPEVEATCDRILIINEGRIVDQGTPADLSAKLKSGQRLVALVVAQEDHVRLALRDVEGISTIATEDMPEGRRRVLIEGDTDADLRKQVSRALVTADIDLIELKAEVVSLEDIFLQLTGEVPEVEDEAEITGAASVLSSVVAASTADAARRPEQEAAPDEPEPEAPRAAREVEPVEAPAPAAPRPAFEIRTPTPEPATDRDEPEGPAEIEAAVEEAAVEEAASEPGPMADEEARLEEARLMAELARVRAERERREREGE